MAVQYIALTGITKQVISDLMDRKIRTLELRSAHNLYSLLQANAGDCVFITTTSKQDLVGGITGVIAKIRELQVTMHRVAHGIDSYYEEKETLFARVQLEFKGLGRIRKVQDLGIGKPVSVDAEEIRHFEAR